MRPSTLVVEHGGRATQMEQNMMDIPAMLNCENIW